MSRKIVSSRKTSSKTVAQTVIRRKRRPDYCKSCGALSVELDVGWCLICIEEMRSIRHFYSEEPSDSGEQIIYARNRIWVVPECFPLEYLH